MSPTRIRRLSLGTLVAVAGCHASAGAGAGAGAAGPSSSFTITERAESGPITAIAVKPPYLWAAGAGGLRRVDVTTGEFETVGEVNDAHVKLVKLQGEFVWHAHEREDELFLVLKGRLTMRFRDGETVLGPGEMIIVPRGIEHMPVAAEETHVLLFEPKTTLNTGDVRNERTVETLERI